MSERHSSVDLGAAAEGLLGAFPVPERDWENDARAIEARLSEAGETNALLLSAPLPAEPGEPHGISAPATRLPNSGERPHSLADLARRSVEKKQSEAREVARASLALAATTRSSVDEARALSVALNHRSTTAPIPGADSAVVSRPPARPRPSRLDGAPGSRSTLAVGLPLLALAAGAVLWLRRPAEPASVVSNALPSATSEARPAAVMPGNTAELSEPTALRGIDPNTLVGDAPSKPAEIARSKAAAGAAPASGASTRSNVEKTGVAEPSRSVARAAPPLENEQQIDKGLPPDPALRPADSSGGALPAKPSTGAVQAALGSVMSGARHCVAGDDAPSSAVVVFGSDGRVQSVSVKGPASGRAAAACIQAQLTKARVQPFAASNFSVNATIRPD